MSGLLDALAPCAALLDAWGHPWALIGGAALIAHVRSRLTEDLDFAVAVAPSEEASFLEHARGRGFTWLASDQALFLEGGLLRARAPGGISVDFLIADDALYGQVVSRAQSVALGGVAVRVATVEDLLLMKLDANRPLDLDDALAIKDAFGPRLDRAYLRSAGERCGLTRSLELILGPL